MEFVSWRPDESTEQWFTRASAEYHAARDALSVELRANYPVLDEGYDGAMDRLEAADSERADAELAVNRSGDQVSRMRADRDGRVADEPSVDPSPRRPVYEDFRGDNNDVDWALFRAAVAAWDAAQTEPKAVQNLFNNSPPS